MNYSLRKKEEIITDEKVELEDISIEAIKNILPLILKVKSVEDEKVEDKRLDKIVRGRIIPVEEKISFIRSIIEVEKEVRFTKIIESCDKDEVIATFFIYIRNDKRKRSNSRTRLIL